MHLRFVRSILFQFLVLILFLPFISNSVFAQELVATPTSASWTLSTLAGMDIVAGKEAVRLEGYMPTVVLDLRLPTNWRSAANSVLLLNYQRSDLVLANATLTIRVNEQSLSSLSLINAFDTVKLEIPATFLHPGQNQIELAAYLPLAEDDECIVPNNPARWLELLPDSQIASQVETDATMLYLADFPMQFAAIGDTNIPPITFVIPDDPDDNELSALAAVAFALARDNHSLAAWHVLSSSEFVFNPANGPVILIGAAERNPHMKRLAPANMTQSGWLSLLSQGQSGHQPLLAVGGATSEAVLKSANALLDPQALVQMNSNAVVIDALPSHEPVATPRQFTMADLGYGERVVRGSGQKSLIYAVDVPFAWSLQSGKLKLNFAHSALIETDKAELAIYLNGHVISGIRLSAVNNTPEFIEIDIPQSQFRPGRNFLRLAFDFGSSVNLCGALANPEGGPWASVYPDTSLTFSGGDQGGGRLNLKDFPYFLATEADWENLLIVLPNQHTNADLDAALNLMRTLSIVDGVRPYAPRWVRAGSMSAEMKKSHLIILGEPYRQPLLQELNSNLPIAFDLQTGMALSTYGIRVPVEQPQLGIVQLLRSSWDANHMILAVSGVGQQGSDWAMRLLTDPSLQPQLAGQVAVISMHDQAQGAKVYTQVIADLGAVPVISTANTLLLQLLGDNNPWSPFVLAVISTLLIALFITLGMRWKLRTSIAKGH